MYNFGTTTVASVTDPYVYSGSLEDWLYFLPACLFSVYFSLYFILPVYLNKRKLSFLIISVLFLSIITLAYCYFISATFYSDNSESITWTETLLKWRGLPVIAGSALIIKIMKDYFLKQQESEKLAIENVNNKLQLLKMQMHPQILFDCLHEIYLDIEAGTIDAPERILQLSDLLSYSLYEAGSEEILLDKKIKMITNFRELKNKSIQRTENPEDEYS